MKTLRSGIVVEAIPHLFLEGIKPGADEANFHHTPGYHDELLFGALSYRLLARSAGSLRDERQGAKEAASRRASPPSIGGVISQNFLSARTTSLLTSSSIRDASGATASVHIIELPLLNFLIPPTYRAGCP